MTYSGGVGYAAGLLATCGGYAFDENIPNADGTTIRSLNLEEAIQAGEPYAISMEFLFDIGVLELWGSNEECGAGVEELYSSPGMGLAGTTFCLDITATQPFSHIIMVWRMGAEHADFTFCPGGTCG
jgi:hypothetical protein